MKAYNIFLKGRNKAINTYWKLTFFCVAVDEKHCQEILDEEFHLDNFIIEEMHILPAEQKCVCTKTEEIKK